MIKNIISGFLVLASVFLFLNCASTYNTKKETAPEVNSKGAISMPSGWDDSIIDEIKSGESPKKIVAVLDFENNEKLKDKVDLKMSDMLTTSLVKTNRFKVVERNKIKKVLDEQKFGLSGMVDRETAAKAGKLIGAEYLVLGSITSATRKDIDKFGYTLVKIEVGVDVRVVNTSSGNILLSESAIGLSESKLVKTADGVVVDGAVDYNSAYADASRDAVNKVGDKIAGLSPLIGFIVTANSKTIYIDLGENQGVNIGDIFVTLRVGSEILHPASGEHLGWKKEILGMIKVINTEKNMSKAVNIRSESDKSIKPGDYIISK